MLYYYYALFICLGIVGGLPHTLLTTAVQAWISVADGSVLYAGSITLLSLPFACRLLWGVVVDYFKNTLRVDYRYTLLVVTTLLSVLVFVLSYYHPVRDYKIFLPLLVIGNVLSATVDTILDGLRILLTPKAHQSRLTATFSSAYRTAFFIVNSMGFIWADYFGWEQLFKGIAIGMLLLGGLLWLAFSFELGVQQDEALDAATSTSSSDTSEEVRLFSWQTWLVLFLVTMLKWHEVFIAALVQPFMLQGMKMSLQHVAIWLNGLGTVANIVGSMVASYGLDFYCRKKVVSVFLLVQFIASCLFIAFVMSHIPMVVNLAILVEKFADGLVNTTIMMIIMQYCNKRYAATQYAFFMSSVSGCRSLLGPLASFIHMYCGWHGYFVLSAMMVMPIAFLVIKTSIGKSFFEYEHPKEPLSQISTA